MPARKYDYDAAWEVYSTVLDDKGRPVSLNETARRTGIPVTQLRKFSSYHGWPKKRQSYQINNGPLGAPPAPPEPAAPAPAPEAPKNLIRLMEIPGVCPHCRGKIGVTPGTLLEYLTTIQAIMTEAKTELDTLKGDSSPTKANKLKALTDTMDKAGKMIQQAQQMQEQAAVKEGGDMLRGKDVDELVRLAWLVWDLLHHCPADDPRVMELTDKFGSELNAP